MSLTIAPTVPLEAASDRIHEYLARDPDLLVADRGREGTLIVFTLTPAGREGEERRLAREGRVGYGYATAQVRPALGTIELHPSGAPESVRRLQAFARWMLATLGPCRVFDNDEGVELTEDVKRDPAVFFGPAT